MFGNYKQKQKLAHYSAVASGKKAPKNKSKYSKAEQIAYASGQRDARNEANRIYAYNNATPEQREIYKVKKAISRANFNLSK